MLILERFWLDTQPQMAEKFSAVEKFAVNRAGKRADSRMLVLQSWVRSLIFRILLLKSWCLGCFSVTVIKYTGKSKFRKQEFNLAHNWTLQSLIPEKPRGQVSEAMGRMASVIWWVCVISSHSSINKDHNPTQGMVSPSVDRDISGYLN